MFKDENTGQKTSLGQILTEAGIPRSEKNLEARKPTGRIILNTDSKKIDKPRKSMYYEQINSGISALTSLKDIIELINDSGFSQVYRKREGSHPITMDTELRWRLQVVMENIQKVQQLFQLESPSYKHQEDMETVHD